MEDKDDDDKRELVLIYGTLKRGQPSHEIVNDESSGKSRFVGKAQTLAKWPLVIASKYNIPFLLLKEGTGNVSTSR
jgi:gamma-glutamylaminecyclotransferase